MKFCKECFKDPELRAQIEVLGHKGTCPICGKKETWIYDSEIDEDNSSVVDNIESILRIYKIESELPNTYLSQDVKSIYECLMEDWDIFNGNIEQIKVIVEEIVHESWDISDKILSNNVGIPELYDENFLASKTIMGQHTWKQFKKSIRNVNRFHSAGFINLNLLAEILNETEILIKKDEKFYRARVSNGKSIKGFKASEMGAPPDDVASPGRANSKGQSCLYLASEKGTTVKEIRAHAFDYVTIATFKLQRDLKIIDLSSITHISPFYSNTDKVTYLLNEKVLREMESDLSKPMSRWDSDLDYLPTQYISDYVRWLGYDGVKYKSTFDKDAYNLAIFDTEASIAVYKRNYLIGDLNYTLEVL